MNQAVVNPLIKNPISRFISAGPIESGKSHRHEDVLDLRLDRLDVDRHFLLLLVPENLKPTKF